MGFLNISEHISTIANYTLTFIGCFVIVATKEFAAANKKTPKRKVNWPSIIYYTVYTTVFATVLNKFLASRFQWFDVEYRTTVCFVLAMISKPLVDAVNNKSIVYSIIKGFAKWAFKNGNDIVGCIKDEMEADSKKSNTKNKSEN